ncbi:MAG: DUF1015 family protein [Kiritimatiellia bacterium]
MNIHPFPALRPAPDRAARVAALPYDVVSTAEASAEAHGNPDCFFHVSRPEIDLPAGADPHSPAAYAAARQALDRLRASGALAQDAEPALFIYRQVMGAHVQRGVAACLEAADYGSLIKTHEKTRPDKEDDRARHIESLEAQTGLVFLLYRDQAAIDRLVAQTEAEKPLYDLTAGDGIRHMVWKVRDSATLARAFQAVPHCYIADGHHRAAAAARHAQRRKAANPAHTGREEYNRFLGVLFPASQLQVLPYNRIVKDLNGLSPTAFLAAVQAQFSVTPAAPPSPPEPGQCSFYLGGSWYGLRLAPAAGADALASLDVSVLQDRLLAPVLGVADPRTSTRIEFIGGIRGPGELMKCVDDGRAAVAFSLHPVTVEQLMAVSDAGQTMPPKSTWFEPKLRSGLLLHTL